MFTCAWHCFEVTDDAAVGVAVPQVAVAAGAVLVDWYVHKRVVLVLLEDALQQGKQARLQRGLGNQPGDGWVGAEDI